MAGSDAKDRFSPDTRITDLRVRIHTPMDSFGGTDDAVRITFLDPEGTIWQVLKDPVGGGDPFERGRTDEFIIDRDLFQLRSLRQLTSVTLRKEFHLHLITTDYWKLDRVALLVNGTLFKEWTEIDRWLMETALVWTGKV